ncbi:hypothetical protein PDESU_01766 [Pontiella desulfatans]|uniref:Uncharacterized protein n=1 Tax=Pontiella desulfatans TaxID=2750659 RepID=A0A6C2TZW8_PONDE|nr:hypothetical protein [Pontiella desulfatans]VGO13212.1 hypothetical protein PDESU_01766 [Pontiella desulfatans]
MKKTGWALVCSIAIASGAHAAPTIGLVGDGDNFDEEYAAARGFRSTGEPKSFDLNLDNVYGSHGYFFFGNGSSELINNQPFSVHTADLPDWVTSVDAGSNFTSTAVYDYTPTDDPTAPPNTDTVDWNSGMAVALGSGASNWTEIVTFSIDSGAPGTFRLGLMTGNEGSTDGRWSPIGLRLSVGGGTAVAVTNLEDFPAGSDGVGMVFFDITTDGSGGTFSVEGQQRLATQGSSLAGMTFDETTAVTFPGGAIKLDQDSLSFDVVAPEMTTNNIINAVYLEGLSASNVELISAVADAGFSASNVSGTLLGTANTNKAITVTFDNTSIGLANGESTNSTLVVTWTEAGSGVTNTSEAALNATYINEPSSVSVAPTSLSLTLEDPATSTNGSVIATYIEGTISADVEIVSIVATNGFSVAPDSFTLSSGTTTQEVVVTYTNDGSLAAHGDTADATVVISWTETGSGITNTADLAVDVIFNKAAEMTKEWTIGIDFGSTTPAGATVFNQMGPYGGNNTTPGVAADAAITNSSLVDIENAPVSGVEFILQNAGQIAWDYGLGGVGELGTDGDGALITNASVFADALICNDASGRILTAGVDFMYFTFTGLDDSLVYDLSAGFDRDNANFDVLWSADGQSAQTANTGAAGAGYVNLTGLGTDGSGNLVISATGVGAAAHITVGAMTLTAFSAGSTEPPVISASVSGGSLIMSWDTGGSYNVLTNADLVYPNWGVATNAPSPVTISIGDETQFFYKLSN